MYVFLRYKQTHMYVIKFSISETSSESAMTHGHNYEMDMTKIRN